MATDFAALGRYMHFAERAKEAAGRRLAGLNNLASDLRRAADQPEQELDMKALHARLDELHAVCADLRLNVELANQAAAESGQPAVSMARLLPQKG